MEGSRTGGRSSRFPLLGHYKNRNRNRIERPRERGARGAVRFACCGGGESKDAWERGGASVRLVIGDAGEGPGRPCEGRGGREGGEREGGGRAERGKRKRTGRRGVGERPLGLSTDPRVTLAVTVESNPRRASLRRLPARRGTWPGVSPGASLPQPLANLSMCHGLPSSARPPPATAGIVLLSSIP